MKQMENYQAIKNQMPPLLCTMCVRDLDIFDLVKLGYGCQANFYYCPAASKNDTQFRSSQ